MMERMHVMSMRGMRVVTCFFVVARIVMCCCLLVVTSRMLVVFSRFPMMLSCLLRHGESSL